FLPLLSIYKYLSKYYLPILPILRSQLESGTCVGEIRGDIQRELPLPRFHAAIVRVVVVTHFGEVIENKLPPSVERTFHRPNLSVSLRICNRQRMLVRQGVVGDEFPYRASIPNPRPKHRRSACRFHRLQECVPILDRVA